MLRSLNIENFAIIDHVTLDLEMGMTVLAGETGAGKSIIIDALSLLMGRSLFYVASSCTTVSTIGRFWFGA